MRMYIVHTYVYTYTYTHVRKSIHFFSSFYLLILSCVIGTENVRLLPRDP